MTSSPVDPPAPTRRPEIRSLTGIRALAALWVLVEHFRFELFGLFPFLQFLSPWVNSGFLGVEVFFVLSGFIISYTYADRFTRVTRTGYRSFLVNRFARIYPVHLVTLVAVGLLVGAAAVAGVNLNSAAKYNAPSFVGNILMLQAFPGISSWNVPAWSISVEFGAYVAFPLIAVALGYVRGARKAAVLAIIWVLTGTALMMAFRVIDDADTSSAMMWLRISTEFVTGCLIWRAWSQAGSRSSSWFDCVAIGAFVAVGLGLFLMGVRIDDDSRPLVLTPLLALFVLGCAGSRGTVRVLLASRAMNWGGRVSYSLYMTHFIVIMMAHKILPWEGFRDASLAMRVMVLVTYYAICILAAWACYEWVETRGRRLVQRWNARLLTRRFERTPAPTKT